MSGHTVKDIKITPNVIRDFSYTYINMGNKTIDLWQEFGVVGLDFLIVNNGASSLTIAWDKHDAVTISAGDSFGIDNTKFSLLEVVSAVNYDLIVAGVHMIKRRES